MERDFAPISVISRSPVVLAVLPDFPANDIKGFIEHVRKESGKHSYASFGQGTTSHIFGETLKQHGKFDMVHVPYRGATAAMQDLLGGRVTGAYLDTGTVLPMLQAAVERRDQAEFDLACQRTLARIEAAIAALQ